LAKTNFWQNPQLKSIFYRKGRKGRKEEKKRYFLIFFQPVALYGSLPENIFRFEL
jgi:hypothetical protein